MNPQYTSFAIFAHLRPPPRLVRQVIHLREGYQVLGAPILLGAEHSNLRIVAHEGERAVVRCQEK